jgi:hypothetical protein
MYMQPEQRKQIESFLETNLPATEERIPIPMHPECEVAVVVPAYEERKNIMQLVESLANQKKLHPNRYEVIVVVNNPREAAPGEKNSQNRNDGNGNRCYRDNQETLKLLRYLRSKEPGEVEPQMTDEEKEVASAIKASGLNLYVIDKSSPGKCLSTELANVGGARNRGVAEAVERFYRQAGKNGIIAQTDADSRVDELYIYYLIKEFTDNPGWVALTGTVLELIERPEDVETMKDFYFSNMPILYYELIANLFNNSIGKNNYSFMGCNNAARVLSLVEVGGVPIVCGGEDTYLGTRLQKLGEVGYSESVVVSAAVRQSQRAATGRGVNLKKYNDMCRKEGSLKVRTLESIFTERSFVIQIQQACRQGNITRRQLEKIVSVGGKPLLSSQQFDILAPAVQKHFLFKAPGNEEEFRKAWDMVCEKLAGMHRLIDIRAAAQQLFLIYEKADEIRTAYRSSFADKLKEIKEYKVLLERLLDDVFDKVGFDGDADRYEIAVTDFLERDSCNKTQWFRGEVGRVKNIARLMVNARTKQDAMETIKANYIYMLEFHPEGSVGWTYLQMKALREALEALKLEQPIFKLAFGAN